MFATESAENLASQMGVTTNDVLSLARSVIGEMKKAKAVSHFQNNQGTGLDVELVEALLPAAIQTSERAQLMYLTNPEARQVFIQRIYSLLA